MCHRFSFHHLFFLYIFAHYYTVFTPNKLHFTKNKTGLVRLIILSTVWDLHTEPSPAFFCLAHHPESLICVSRAWQQEKANWRWTLPQSAAHTCVHEFRLGDRCEGAIGGARGDALSAADSWCCLSALAVCCCRKVELHWAPIIRPADAFAFSSPRPHSSLLLARRTLPRAPLTTIPLIHSLP